MAISASSGILNGITVASSVAAVVSAWMFIGSIGLKGFPGCGVGSGCDAVTRGRWSRWGAVPVSGVGFAVYALLLAATLLLLWNNSAKDDGVLAEVMLTCAWLVIGSIIWFVILQAVVVRRFCAYCMLVHLCGAAAAVMAFAWTTGSSAGAFGIPLAVASTGLVILIAGQIILVPKTFVVVATPAPVVENNSAEAAIDRASDFIPSRPVTNRRVKLRSGRVVIGIDEFPAIGPVDAEHVIACLFDHTCEECHHLHRLLLQAVDHYEGRLAVVTIPVPLNASCNPSVKCYSQERAYSCVYARLEWAMWTVDMDRHAQWVRFMAEDEQVKPFGVALQKAKELADISRFELREFDPELDKRIATGLEIHRMAGEPKIPALLLPAGMVLGHIPTLKVMIETLENHMSLNRPKGSTAVS